MSHPSIANLHPVLLALSTATGAVTFLVTRHPEAQLAHLGMQLEVDHRLIVSTPHAERIANELRNEFSDKAISTFGNHPYFLIDWEDAERAIADFDPVTGHRLRRGDVAVGDQVQVEITTASPGNAGKRRGEVTGISGQRYLVRLLEPIGDCIGMWAPRSAIKPIVRGLAAAGAA